MLLCILLLKLLVFNLNLFLLYIYFVNFAIALTNCCFFDIFILSHIIIILTFLFQLRCFETADMHARVMSAKGSTTQIFSCLPWFESALSRFAKMQLELHGCLFGLSASGLLKLLLRWFLLFFVSFWLLPLWLRLNLVFVHRGLSQTYSICRFSLLERAWVRVLLFWDCPVVVRWNIVRILSI